MTHSSRQGPPAQGAQRLEPPQFDIEEAQAHLLKAWRDNVEDIMLGKDMLACAIASLSHLSQRVKEMEEETARVLEDRARFPDRPDFVGNMIAAHIGNLKAGKESADQHARRAMDRADSKQRTIDALRSAMREADKVACRHRRGAAGEMQAIIRRALGKEHE